ncbi:15675_t:CDS:1 [Cetraspora pellucida]|uniref:15675_t:CDS:1 n=1 Tax=Cetraspora pellucida TaxID=1433469 RepID=A0A9N9HMU4_9GLOM|nr:15675_t:CDS:1 [Cetraspora pellucida]
MVFKLCYSNPSFINSTIHVDSIDSISSLLTLPNELLLLLFETLDIPTILSLSNVCNKFLLIAQVCLAKRFKTSNLELTLLLDQEYRRKNHINFSFDHFDSKTERFVFTPKKDKAMRFINSRMIGCPKLRRIQLSGFDNNNTFIDKNLLQKACTLPIESNNSILQKISSEYRIGRGSTHLKSTYTFTYSISDSPPPFTISTRRGERWIKPLRFECSPCFFYPHEPIAHKIIMDLIHFKKKNQNKKHNMHLLNLSETSLCSIESERDDDAITEQRQRTSLTRLKRYYRGVRR